MADAKRSVNSIVNAPKARQNMPMPLRFVLSALLFWVAACAPVSVYYRENAPVARQQSDLLACRVDSLDKAPVATEIREGPPRYVPGYRYCNNKGNCSYRGGYYVRGPVYSVDVNAGLRGDLETQCMGQKGYQPVALPRCTAGTTVLTSDRMPALSETSCAYKDDQNRWQIVQPAG